MTIGLGIGVLVTGALIGVGVLFGVVSFSFDAGARTTGGAQVCGNDVVERYNKVSVLNSIETTDTYKQQLNDLYRDIAGRAHHLDDATCVYIVYQYYVSTNDTERVNSTVAVMKMLSSEGNFPSNGLAALQNLQQVESRASIMEGNIEAGSAGGAG